MANLKITPEHYAVLESACKDVLAANPGVTLQTYESQGLSPMRFNWDVLYAAKINGQKSSLWVSDVLYAYLNDDHINSALARILGNSGKSGKQLRKEESAS